MESRKLPVGIENFQEIRTEGFYYVDKTGLIRDLLNNWGKVNLFTRPRRFGKTLNMSMLKSFFEIGADRTLFDGLAISRETALCEAYMGRFPVVFVSLKGVDGLTFDLAYQALCGIVVEEFSRLRFLIDSDKLAADEKQYLEKMLNGQYEEADLRGSLKKLATLLEKHYGQKVILLIDEYDVPLDKAYAHGYYPQMVDLIRAMFGVALKTNDSLFFAVLTGCLRVSKESIFTGLNNLKVHSISDVKYDEYFGFTDQEVGEMLTCYGLENHHAETREWYDGYRFGEQNVYCPWDVINFCDDLRASDRARPKAYWINSSGNDAVRKLIDKSSTATTRRDIERLIEGETVVKTLNENLTHSEIADNIENLWSLLYMTGYLTAADYPDGNQYRLKIPNREVRQIYTQQVMSWFRDKAEKDQQDNHLNDLYAAFEKGDTETITSYLNKQLIATVSYYDAQESFYHGFLLALLNTCASWQVSSNVETGTGRSDIIVEREDGQLGFVVEVKDVKDRSKLDAACDAAMKQIEEKDYTAVLRRYGVEEIWTYGVAFCEKRCKVVAKQMA